MTCHLPRLLLPLAALLTGCLGPSNPAPSGGPTGAGPSSAGPSNAGPICLRSYEIDRTDTPDDNTIIFTMRDHSVWKNTLVGRCTGLRLETRGFIYQPTDPASDTICSNLVTIRLPTTGEVCLLGAFTRLPPTPRQP